MNARGRLNAICPYFTMFPLEFPLGVLRDARPGEWVMDPFCGRGTTNYAARSLGLPSIGLDSSPVAVALTQAKLANTSPTVIVAAARRLLDGRPEPSAMPEGEFWRWAFHEDVLRVLCRLREGLLENCGSDARKALRAILMGALHGPRPKSRPTYFSNQSPRTYAPKPRYAVGYWKKHDLAPEPVDVLRIVSERAERYYAKEEQGVVGKVVCGVVRFGGINDRKADPLSIIEASLRGSGFEVRAVTPAGSASSGQRQALHFARSSGEAREEHDVWATCSERAPASGSVCLADNHDALTNRRCIP